MINLRKEGQEGWQESKEDERTKETNHVRSNYDFSSLSLAFPDSSSIVRRGSIWSTEFFVYYLRPFTFLHGRNETMGKERESFVWSLANFRCFFPSFSRLPWPRLTISHAHACKLRSLVFPFSALPVSNSFLFFFLFLLFP